MIANELSNEQGHIESASGFLIDLMPDGVEAAKRIRMLPGEETTRIPIIVLTANAFFDDANRCREAGMNAHLAKPIDIDRLVQTIVDVMKV